MKKSLFNSMEIHSTIFENGGKNNNKNIFFKNRPNYFKKRSCHGRLQLTLILHIVLGNNGHRQCNMASELHRVFFPPFLPRPFDVCQLRTHLCKVHPTKGMLGQVGHPGNPEQADLGNLFENYGGFMHSNLF